MVLMTGTDAGMGRERQIGWPALVGWFVVHTVVWIGLVKLLPGDDFVEYPDLGVIGLPWVRQFVVPLAVVLALQVALVSWLGWWRPVMRDDPRRASSWMYVPPVLVALAGVGAFARAGMSDAPLSYWVGVTATMALVGLTEELTFRGILLAGGRRLTDERRAWLVSSALFGLFHLPNVVLGQAWGSSVTQVVATAIIGSALYCTRRVTGALLPAIVLHAVYDWMLIQGNAVP